ncbi:MAG: insulinase family protein, partial [Parahaliea sp.]
DYRAAYRTQPLSYLGNLIGHEGEGSLLSQLKVEGLAESLGAGAGLDWRGGELFSVSVVLTERGVTQYQRVLHLLFTSLDLLRQQGPQQRLYDEQSRIAALRFRFKEDFEPINYVSALASSMHYFAPRDVLQGPYLMTDYRPALLREALAKLVPENALVVLSDEQVQTDRVSRYYAVPYARQTLAAAGLAHWRGAPEPALHLPAANEFIADDVSLVALATPVPAIPQKVLAAGRQTVWFLQDDEFRVPKGATYINFRSTEVGQSPRQAALAVLYTALLKDAVNEFAYPATLAGLNFDLYKHAQGISRRISGYNVKQGLLLERLLSTLRAADFDEARFANIRADMIRGLRNAIAKRPSSQVIDDLREALLYGEWNEDALVGVLQDLQLEDLASYTESFWDSATAETLLYGNYRPEAAGDVAASIAPLLPGGPAPAIEPLRVLRLAAGESLQLVADVPHDDSVVAWYLQGAGNSWRDRAATDLSGQIIKSGFFQQLRTEQQLGYVVAALPWSQLDVPALLLLIQSPGSSAAQVASAISAFMSQVPEATGDAVFERHREALLQEINKPDKNLWERAEFLWQSLARKELAFDARQQLSAAVRDLTREDWLAYYRQVFLIQPHSLQAVAPGRWNGDLPPVDGRVFRDAARLKQGHPAYLVE